MWLSLNLGFCVCTWLWVCSRLTPQEMVLCILRLLCAANPYICINAVTSLMSSWYFVWIGGWSPWPLGRPCLQCCCWGCCCRDGGCRYSCWCCYLCTCCRWWCDSCTSIFRSNDWFSKSLSRTRSWRLTATIVHLLTTVRTGNHSMMLVAAACMKPDSSSKRPACFVRTATWRVVTLRIIWPIESISEVVSDPGSWVFSLSASVNFSKVSSQLSVNELRIFTLKSEVAIGIAEMSCCSCETRHRCLFSNLSIFCWRILNRTMAAFVYSFLIMAVWEDTRSLLILMLCEVLQKITRFFQHSGNVVLAHCNFAGTPGAPTLHQRFIVSQDSCIGDISLWYHTEFFYQPGVCYNVV